MSSELEKQPNHILADRVWSGMNWHYPHLETLKAELSQLRAQLAEAVADRAVLAGEVKAKREKIAAALVTADPDDWASIREVGDRYSKALKDDDEATAATDASGALTRAGGG